MIFYTNFMKVKFTKLASSFSNWAELKNSALFHTFADAIKK